MKRLFLLLIIATLAFGWVSCGKHNDYKLLIGTWGLERLEYDTLDFSGAPIVEYRVADTFPLGDPNNGIEMIFRDDRTGETRDHAIDSLKLDDGTYIQCPDTTMVTKFTYSYIADEASLYINITVNNSTYHYQTHVAKFDNNAFVYENEYKKNCIERAYLVRLSDTPAAKSSKSVGGTRHTGSVFSRQPSSFNQ